MSLLRFLTQGQSVRHMALTAVGRLVSGYAPPAPGKSPGRHAHAVLVHPATLASLALLLVNDHLLRHAWPSPFTGKLGDFAWLFFAPLALGAFLELARPGRLASLLGFGLVAGTFALAKTVPLAHATVVAAASRLFGFPVGWQRDPTDLVALLALIPAWLLWQRATPRAPCNRPAAGLVIAAAALLTVANSPAPDYGYRCVWAAEGKLFAARSYEASMSTDGGITWQRVIERLPGGWCPDNGGEAEPGARILVDPAHEGVRYRYTPGGQVIERSADGGLTWEVEYRLEPEYEAAAAYESKKRPGGIVKIPLPASAAVDPGTGNVVFAMGYRGILVRKADGAYTWSVTSQDGTYGFSAARAPDLLMGEGVLAIGVLLLGLCTLGRSISRTWARDLLLVIGWLLWGLAALAAPPALSHGYDLVVTWAMIMAAALVTLPLTADTIFRLATHRPRALPQILLVAAGAALLFLLPYVLWALNAVPRYYLAAAFAVALVVGALFAGHARTKTFI